MASPSKPRWSVFAIAFFAIAAALWLLRGRLSSPPFPAAATSARAAPANGAPRPRPADPRKSRRASVEGRVVDPAGAPIAGAAVCGSASSAQLSEAETREPLCTLSGADGRYRLADLLPARYSVDASAEARKPLRWRAPTVDRAPFVDLEAGEARTGIDFVLEPGAVRVQGVVKDLSGGVIGGALVVVWSNEIPAGRDAGAITRTNAKGAFVAWVAEGRVRARAGAEGYAEGEKRGVAPGPDLEILLTPESVLIGRVVDAARKTPIAGAHVGLEENGYRGRDDAAITDAEGRFRIGRLEPGRYKPIATAPGGFGQARESVLLGLGQTSSELLVEVHPAAAVTGRVLIADAKGKDGAPSPCARGDVTLEEHARKLERWAVLERDGTARFDGLLPGTYEVHVTCKDHVAEPKYPPVVLAAKDVEGLVWNVRPGLAIRGRVVDADDKPAPSSVRAVTKGGDPRAQRSDAYGETEPDGTFTLRGLVPATYNVIAIVPGRPEPDPVAVELREGPVPEVKIVVGGGGGIEGTIADEDGHAIAGAGIQASGPKRAWGEQATSMPDGSFAIKGLMAGDYRVTARKDGVWLKAPGEHDDDPGGVPAAVKAGATARVRLVVQRLDGAIRGRVTDEIGEPVTDAFVDAERETESASAAQGSSKRSVRWGWSRTPALTELDGSFTVSGLAPGKYVVRAHRKGGGEAFAEHVPVGGTAALVIQRTGAIAGSIVAGAAAPAMFTIVVSDRLAGLQRRETFFQTDGAWAVRDLPAGTYVVSADAPEGTASAEIALADSEQREGVALTLASRATITGTLVSLDDGAPIAGMRVYAGARGPSYASSSGDDPDKNNLSDAAGRFRIQGAPAGPILISAGAMDWRTSDYGWLSIPAEAPAGVETDVGKLALPKRRVKAQERAGDLGFATRDRLPGADPVDVTFDVAVVRTGGPASAAGLAVGDVIVSVDGHDVTARMTYLYATLVRVPEGTTVTLGLKRGAAIAVTAVKPP